MPGGITTAQRYTDMAAFRKDEPRMHAAGWATQWVQLQAARRGAWSHLIRRRRRQQVDVRYSR